jgi:hypothetical protein
MLMESLRPPKSMTQMRLSLHPTRLSLPLPNWLVFRLNVKRAMVSLIDTNNQYILAEATRNLRLGTLAEDPTDADTDTDNKRTSSISEYNSELWCE